MHLHNLIHLVIRTYLLIYWCGFLYFYFVKKVQLLLALSWSEHLLCILPQGAERGEDPRRQTPEGGGLW